MMVCYSGAENQSLPVRKKMQLGDSSSDALSRLVYFYSKATGRKSKQLSPIQ